MRNQLMAFTKLIFTETNLILKIIKRYSPEETQHQTLTYVKKLFIEKIFEKGVCC